MKENRQTNDLIWKASSTAVSWWISIHGLAHLGLRRSTGRQYWGCACAICGDNKTQLCVSWPRNKSWGTNVWIGQYHYFNIYTARARRLNTERRAASRHHGGRSWAPGRGAPRRLFSLYSTNQKPTRRPVVLLLSLSQFPFLCVSLSL